MRSIIIKRTSYAAASGLIALAAVVGLVKPASAEDCVHATPTISYVSALNQSGYVNEARFYVMDVTNNDSAACADATVTTTVPFTHSPTNEVFAYTTPSGPVSLAPQATVRTVVTVQAEYYAALGDYPFTATTTVHNNDVVPADDVVFNTNIVHSVVANQPPVGDTTKPNVKFLAPVAGQILQRNVTYTLRSQASDNVGVVSLVYRTNNGGTNICMGSGDLTSCNWKPTTKGAQTLTVTATDAAGNSRTASVLVNVK